MIQTRSLFVSFISLLFFLCIQKGIQKSTCITPAYKKQETVSCCFCCFYVCTLSAPLIFKAIAFVRWVVTHSLADFNFHDNCPDVLIQQHFLWYLKMSVQWGTFKTNVRFIPHHLFCLPKQVHKEEKVLREAMHNQRSNASNTPI